VNDIHECFFFIFIREKKCGLVFMRFFHSVCKEWFEVWTLWSKK
jgi:sarcosine oxidase delta subunit